jgi:hypothetical protein
MSAFDYGSEAGLFSVKGLKFKQKHLGYRRFEHAAEAIRFAIEELPLDVLRCASLEADDAVYMGSEIRKLYESEGYPLQRRAKHSK